MFGFFGGEACRILAPGQASSPHPLHWKVKSEPLDFQGSPPGFYLIKMGTYLSVPVDKELTDYLLLNTVWKSVSGLDGYQHP